MTRRQYFFSNWVNLVMGFILYKKMYHAEYKRTMEQLITSSEFLQEVPYNALTFSSFTMDGDHIFLMAREPLMYVLTERLNFVDWRWFVIPKRVSITHLKSITYDHQIHHPNELIESRALCAITELFSLVN